MPLFEYVCMKCGHRFEALVLGSQRPVCPNCQSGELEQEISAFAMGHEGRQGSGTASARPAAGCASGGGGGGG